MRALYDLSRYLTSFNFVEWLVQAEADGAEGSSSTHAGFARTSGRARSP